MATWLENVGNLKYFFGIEHFILNVISLHVKVNCFKKVPVPGHVTITKQKCYALYNNL